MHLSRTNGGCRALQSVFMVTVGRSVRLRSFCVLKDCTRKYISVSHLAVKSREIVHTSICILENTLTLFCFLVCVVDFSAVLYSVDCNPR